MEFKGRIESGRIDRSRLVKKEYYQAVIRAMEEQGFKFLSWVTMESNAHGPYHIKSYPLAVHSMMFFYHPQGTMIVRLELIQKIGGCKFDKVSQLWEYTYNEYRAYWSASVLAEYNRMKMFADDYKASLDKHLADFDHEFERYEITEHFNDKSVWRSMGTVSAENFIEVSLEQRQHDPGIVLPMIPELVTVFGEIANQIAPYLFRKFRNLNRLSFEPHYCFPEEESSEYFWNKFNLTRLNRIGHWVDLRRFN